MGRRVSEGDDNPFSPFRRWTWTTPPERWRQAVGSGLLFGLVVFPGLAACFYLFKWDRPQWGFIAFFIFSEYTTHSFVDQDLGEGSGCQGPS